MPDNKRDSAGTLGRIALKQVRVPRTGAPAGAVEQAPSNASATARNKLVPYLDLFGRLDDGELSRLASVPTSVVASMRTQVDEICNALEAYADLLPRLGDPELMRLTGATDKTVRFWRLCNAAPTGGTMRGAAPGRVSGDRVGSGPVPGVPTPTGPSPAAFDERLEANELRLGLLDEDRSQLDNTMAISVSNGSEFGDDDDEISFDLVDDDDY